LNVEFKNKHLKQLYEQSRSRKYRIPESVLKKFFMRIRQLRAAKTVYDLWNFGSLNFERLEGYENRFSLRLNVQWRLEVEVDWEDEEKTTGKIYIVELSKHYGD
jgi:plasmid maintenance system killer protein